MAYLTADREETRVLLMVPPYTRVKRPLDVVEENIENGVTGRERLGRYRGIISGLRESGIYELSEMKRAGMPVGLMRIGTAAKKRGYDVKIVDSPFEDWENESDCYDGSTGNILSVYGLSEKKLKEIVRNYSPDVVGITCPYTHQRGNAKWLAGIVKGITVGRTPIVYGGADPTAEPAAFIEDDNDYVVMRQGDETFPELLDFLSGRGGKTPEKMEGLAYMKGGGIVRNRHREFLMDIDGVLLPDLSLIDLGLYNKRKNSMGEDPVRDGYQATIFTSAGCNKRCNFCQIPKVHGPYAAAGDAKLLEVVNYMEGNDVRHLLIEDDNIAHDTDRLERIYSMFEGTGTTSSCEGGIAMYEFNGLQLKDKKKAERIIRQMAKGGCRHVYLAAESGNEKSLEASHKPAINADFSLSRNTVSLFRRYGIKVTLGSMMGMPLYGKAQNGSYTSESVEDVENTIRYMNALGADFHNPFISTPLPGTDYGEMFRSYMKPGHGCSHEFATYDAPGGEWIADELNLLRVSAMGIENYRKTIETGTWA